jgi:anti-anti-sigma factor
VDLKVNDYPTEDGLTVIDVEGEIDVYTAPKLREKLIDLVNKGNFHLLVNMEKVEFLDSTGLGVLVGGLKRVRVTGTRLHAGADPEDLPHHRVDEGLRHLRFGR